jgi:hypothetical protein
MTRKLVAFAVVLGITLTASWVPRAEAWGDDCDSYCNTADPSDSCTCPGASDRPGDSAICQYWQTSNPHGCFLL